jgi:hypothetical protein
MNKTPVPMKKMSTWQQRKEIYELAGRIGKRPPEGFRNFSEEEADAEIKRLKKEIYTGLFGGKK